MPVLVGNRIFLHMPKTGGTWVSNYLRECHGGQLLPGHGHQPACIIPRHVMEGRSLFGTIRDPWSWYTSWYRHALSSGAMRKKLRIYGGGSIEFKDVMEGVLEPKSHRCPEDVGVIWTTESPTASRRMFLGGPGGLYTWAFFYIFGIQPPILIDMYQLHEGLGELLGVEIDPGKWPPVNEGDNRSVDVDVGLKPEWDDDLTDAVWDSDSFITSTIGYEDAFGPAPSALVRV
jgi:hypothetical protein